LRKGGEKRQEPREKQEVLKQRELSGSGHLRVETGKEGDRSQFPRWRGAIKPKAGCTTASHWRRGGARAGIQRQERRGNENDFQLGSGKGRDCPVLTANERGSQSSEGRGSLSIRVHQRFATAVGAKRGVEKRRETCEKANEHAERGIHTRCPLEKGKKGQSSWRESLTLEPAGLQVPIEKWPRLIIRKGVACVLVEKGGRI